MNKLFNYLVLGLNELCFNRHASNSIDTSSRVCRLRVSEVSSHSSTPLFHQHGSFFSITSQQHGYIGKRGEEEPSLAEWINPKLYLLRRGTARETDLC